MTNPTAQIKNLIRIGRVIEVNADTARARVQWGQDESAVTDWIRWTSERAGKVSVWNPPTVGEEVELISIDGDMRNAYIGRSFYNNDNPAPSTNLDAELTKYSDGTTIEHNRASGARTVAGLKSLTTTADATTHNGDVTHKGNNTCAGTLTQAGSAAFNGGITGKGGVSVDVAHTHNYVDDGSTRPSSGVNP
jgi:phage baseplate assembly protein V